jgi:uncharacterized protein (UPF0333 family)
MMKNKAQISVEYLIIIGLSFAVLIPTGYFFYSYSQSSNEETMRLQISQLGNEMLKNSESIYGLADGSLVTLDLKYPGNIRRIYVLNSNELVINYELSSGINDAVFYSRVPLSGMYNIDGTLCTPPCGNSTFSTLAPTKGQHSLKFESRTSYVLITILE